MNCILYSQKRPTRLHLVRLDHTCIQWKNNIYFWLWVLSRILKNKIIHKNEKFHLMINFDEVSRVNVKELNPDWHQTPNNPYRIFLFAISTYKLNFQYLTKKVWRDWSRTFQRPKVFIDYSSDIKMSTKMSTKMLQKSIQLWMSIEDCYPEKERKVLIFADDIIADLISKNKLYPVATELFIRDGN